MVRHMLIKGKKFHFSVEKMHLLSGLEAVRIKELTLITMTIILLEWTVG